MGSYGHGTTPSPKIEAPMYIKTKELPLHIHSVDDVVSDPMAIPRGRTEDGEYLACWYPHPSAAWLIPRKTIVMALGKLIFLHL